MSVILLQNELPINGSPGGLVISSTNAAIRFRGTDTTSLTLPGKGATANQIQFYSGITSTPPCVGAFDVSGIFINEGMSIQTGSDTAYLKLNHTGTTSTMTYNDNLSFSIGSASAISFSSTAVTMSKEVDMGTNAITCGSFTATTLNTDCTIAKLNYDKTVTDLGPNLRALITYIIQNIMNNNFPTLPA